MTKQAISRIREVIRDKTLSEEEQLFILEKEGFSLEQIFIVALGEA